MAAARLKPEAHNYIWVSHRFRASSNWAILSYFPRHMIRELEQKWESSGVKQASVGDASPSVLLSWES